MSENLKPKTSAGIEVRYVKRTAEQEAATQKMLASPCPYCSDPAKFQRELKGKGKKDHETGIARSGKFWRRDEEQGMVRVWSYDHGDYFRFSFDDEHFIPRFKDFRLDVINFRAEYTPFFWASDSLLFMIDAAPSDLARRNKFGLNVARVTHKKSPVVVDAHTWFSHGTLLTVHHIPKEISSADITVMQQAFEFFRPETRGAPKIKRADMWAALDKLGAEVTQAQIAAELGVSERTVRDWLKREDMRWTDFKQQFYLYESGGKS